MTPPLLRQLEGPSVRLAAVVAVAALILLGVRPAVAPAAESGPFLATAEIIPQPGPPATVYVVGTTRPAWTEYNTIAVAAACRPGLTPPVRVVLAVRVAYGSGYGEEPVWRGVVRGCPGS